MDTVSATPRLPHGGAGGLAVGTAHLGAAKAGSWHLSSAASLTSKPSRFQDPLLLLTSASYATKPLLPPAAHSPGPVASSHVATASGTGLF